jgi:hypothetical protein
VGGRPTVVDALAGAALPAGRPPADQRRFASPAVDKTIADYAQRMVTRESVLFLFLFSFLELILLSITTFLSSPGGQGLGDSVL